MVSDELDRVLVEHDLPPHLTVDGIGSAADMDYDRALRWLEENPTDVVFAYTYNGDTGACENLTFLALSNLRAEHRGAPRTPIYRTAAANQCVPAPETRILPRPVETKQLPQVVSG